MSQQDETGNDGETPMLQWELERDLLQWELDKHKRRLDEVYRDRNVLALLAMALAQDAGYEVGFGVDALEPEWPVVYIKLPTGQVSWHLPQEIRALAAEAPDFGEVWDGHTTEEKRERIMRFLAREPAS